MKTPENISFNRINTNHYTVLHESFIYESRIKHTRLSYAELQGGNKLGVVLQDECNKVRGHNKRGGLV